MHASYICMKNAVYIRQLKVGGLKYTLKRNREGSWLLILQNSCLLDWKQACQSLQLIVSWKQYRWSNNNNNCVCCNGYICRPFDWSWSTIRSRKASELASSIRAFRILSRPVRLWLGDAEGKSWECKLASAGSVQGVDFDAALHTAPAFGDLETVLSFCNVHFMTRMQSSKTHGDLLVCVSR